MTIDATGLAALIGAAVAAITALIGGAASVFRWAKAQAKADLLQEQSRATIEAKNKELADLQTENEELRTENARLWGLVPEKLP